MADNYILKENQEYGVNLESLEGLDVHAVLSYIKQNYYILNNKICMFSAKTTENDTILTLDSWVFDDNNDTYKAIISITNTPTNFDYTDTENVNFIIAPTEKKGYNNAGDSEESSRVLYNDAMIRCDQFSINNNKIELSFLADDLLEYNIYLNILVLYKPKNNFIIQ